MKATSTIFAKENPSCAQIAGNMIAEEVFNLLSEDENIIAMIEASEQGRPALTPCVGQVEKLLEEYSSSRFDVNNPVVRQTIGCMVKTILRPFGYRVTKQKNLPKGSGKYFASASCYALSAPEEASMRVIKKIEEIPLK